MFMILKNYFYKLKKRFTQKRESILKIEIISKSEAILRKNFERNMQRLFDKYKNV